MANRTTNRGFLLPFFLFTLTYGQTEETVRQEMNRAIRFFHSSVASEGGYLYRYSADLTKQEGEGYFDRDVIEVQPPGTPAVGQALLRAWQRTDSPAAKAACLDAARVLLRGQLHSGGWQHQILLDPTERGRQAYVIDGTPGKKARNVSSLDDDQTTSALRFLMAVDKALDFADADIHRATLTALDALLAAQYANGAWAQAWQGPADPTTYPARSARLPKSWSRTYQGHNNYWYRPTLNDNVMANVLTTLLQATQTYGEDRYREAALRGGDFLIRAQLPEPQAGWAQQYNEQMEPIWARKFEPPAISGSEASAVVHSLMDLYVHTQDAKWLKPIPRALDYYQSSTLPDGRLARFYELGSNKPLYFTRSYEVTYKDNDLPTHYAFKVGDWTPKARKRLASIRSEQASTAIQRPSDAYVSSLIAALDERGAWVEDGKLRYQGNGEKTSRIIECSTFIKHLDHLSAWLSTSP